MPSRHDLSILRVSTWTIAFVFLALMVFKPPVLGFVLLTLWMRLLLSDLHAALPADFYESEGEGVRLLSLWFVLNMVTLALAAFRALVAWTGLDVAAMIPTWAWAVMLIPGLVLWFRLVRHVLSAIDTVSDRHPRQVGAVPVVLNMLVLPGFVLFSHHNARRAVLR